MSSRRLLPALALSGFCLLSGNARADSVTPAQASDLEAQLRAWMAGLVSPAIDVGPRPVQATADGDHFNIVLPVPDVVSTTGVVPQGLAVTMKARPLDGGRWALDDLVAPSPVTVTPPKDLGADDKAAGKPFVFSVENQQFHGLLDPSFATTSSFDTRWTGFRLSGSNSTSFTQSSVSHSIWQPTTDGKINVLTDGTSEQSKSDIEGSDGKKVTYTIAKTRSSSRINNVSPASLASLIRSVAALVPTISGTKDSLSPDQRTLARTAVFALRDMFGGAEAAQTLEGIKFDADGHGGTLAKATLGMKMGVTDGKLELATQIGMEGLDSPEVPAGVFREYLPRKLSLKPRVSGIPSEDLVKLMLRAIDSDASDMADLQASAVALLGAGPLEVAIDELELDLGKAALSATGSLDVTSPNDITGEAEISMSGLEALIKRANTTPEIKQIAPVLIFLKGIGKQDGEKTVWTVNYEDNKVMVNDTDLSDLIPGQK